MKKNNYCDDIYFEEESVLDYCDFIEYFHNHFRNSVLDCDDTIEISDDDQHPFYEPKIFRRSYDE